jgi:exopolysaccharide biosynthesis polyprenyl glycosylphosphotransferase
LSVSERPVRLPVEATDPVGTPPPLLDESARHGTARGWLMRRLLALADVTGLAVAFVVAMLVVDPQPSDVDEGEAWKLALFALTLPLWILLARVHGLYERDEERSDHSTVDDFVGVFHVVTVGTWVAFVVTHVPPIGGQISSGRLIVFWALAILFVPLFRALMRFLGRRNPAYVQNVLIVGSGSVARLLAEKIARHPEYGLHLVGFVDRDTGPHNGWPEIDLIGAPDDLPRLVDEYGIGRVVIAFSTDSHEQTLEVINSVHGASVQVDIVPRLFEALGTNAQLHTIEGVPLVGLPSPRLSTSSLFLKRSLDLVGATLGVLLFAPILLATAVWIKLDSRGPVFFRQVRMGEDGREFRIFKFRTMWYDADRQKAAVAHLNMHDADPRMFKVPNDPRVTRAGAFLRRWRIDELPQLFNVLRGEMSLVGPRPLILDEDRYVESRARRRLDLKPGMTGLWQVLGASDIPFEEMTKLDYVYVMNWSLREDLRLILLTLPSLTRSRSAY